MNDSSRGVFTRYSAQATCHKSAPRRWPAARTCVISWLRGRSGSIQLTQLRNSRSVGAFSASSDARSSASRRLDETSSSNPANLRARAAVPRSPNAMATRQGVYVRNLHEVRSSRNRLRAPGRVHDRTELPPAFRRPHHYSPSREPAEPLLHLVRPPTDPAG